MATVKTACPITRDQFINATFSIKTVKDTDPTSDTYGEMVQQTVPTALASINVGRLMGQTPLLPVDKTASGGSMGWNYAGKTKIDVGGVVVTVQVGINLTIIGSKPGSEARTKCPIDSDYFAEHAEPLPAVLLSTIEATAKQFQTGSLGWGFNDKINVRVGSHVVKCQCGVNLTIIGSKELPY